MTAKPKILVVDDDRSICKLMGSILEMESYPFRVAMTGEQARRAMEEERFDILVSDIYLGDDSGLHLLERMKCVNADAEVVIMTAHGSMETAVHAVHNGAFDYISKPFVIDESNRLNQLIQSFLDIAYIESGKHRITKSDFEVAPMLKDMISTVGPVAAGKQITIQSSGADGIRVHADRLLVYQALTNQIGRASCRERV